MTMTTERFIEKHIDKIDNKDQFEHQLRNNLRIIE